MYVSVVENYIFCIESSLKQIWPKHAGKICIKSGFTVVWWKNIFWKYLAYKGFPSEVYLFITDLPWPATPIAADKFC